MDKKEPQWAKYINEDDLPNEEMEVFCSIIGLEATKKIMLAYQGSTITIPKLALSKYKDRYILENYNGTKLSRVHLAKECNVSERHIYNVVKDHIDGNRI